MEKNHNEKVMGREKITLGTPFHARAHKDYQDIYQLYTHTRFEY